MNIKELKQQKSRMETMWLKLHNELTNGAQEDIYRAMSEAQDNIRSAIDSINYEIGQKK